MLSKKRTDGGEKCDRETGAVNKQRQVCSSIYEGRNDFILIAVAQVPVPLSFSLAVTLTIKGVMTWRNQFCLDLLGY